MKFLLQGLNVFCWRTFSAKFINGSHSGDRAMTFPTAVTTRLGLPLKPFQASADQSCLFFEFPSTNIFIPPLHLGVSSQTDAQCAMRGEKSHFQLGDLLPISISAKPWLRNCSLPQTKSFISDPWLHLDLSDAWGHLFIIHCTSAEQLFSSSQGPIKDSD